MGSFTDSLNRNIDRVKKEIDTKLYNIFADLASTVVYNCPILRGNLINDFWAASNTYNTTTQTPIDADLNSKTGPHSDVTGSGSLGRIKDVQKLGTFYGKDGFLSFSTSVNYAYKIEYDGWSKVKAPTGFIRNSVVAIGAKYANGYVQPSLPALIAA
jgi:hypothetical protein